LNKAGDDFVGIFTKSGRKAGKLEPLEEWLAPLEKQDEATSGAERVRSSYSSGLSTAAANIIFAGADPKLSFFWTCDGGAFGRSLRWRRAVGGRQSPRTNPRIGRKR
jgi:hypothetical protein